MKKNLKKLFLMTAAVVLLAGTASEVAQAHSGHHSQRKKTAVCYAVCYQDGGCTLNGSCDENGVCLNGGYCTGIPCSEDGAVCSDSYYTGNCTGIQSGHHAGRGHRSHH